MAANSVTILIEMSEKLSYGAKPQLLEQFKTALSYAPGMDELDLNDWRELSNLLERGLKGEDVRRELHQETVRVLGEQIRIWEWLAYPRCHEDWVRTRYSDPRPNHARLIKAPNRARDMFGYFDDPTVSDDKKQGIIIALVSMIQATTQPCNFEDNIRTLKYLHDTSWRGQKGEQFPAELLPKAWLDTWHEVTEEAETLEKTIETTLNAMVEEIMDFTKGETDE